MEVVQANTQLFMEEDFSGLPLTSIGNSIAYRRISEGSLLSNSSGLLEHIPDQVIKTCTFDATLYLRSVHIYIIYLSTIMNFLYISVSGRLVKYSICVSTF